MKGQYRQLLEHPDVDADNEHTLVRKRKPIRRSTFMHWTGHVASAIFVLTLLILNFVQHDQCVTKEFRTTGYMVSHEVSSPGNANCRKTSTAAEHCSIFCQNIRSCYVPSRWRTIHLPRQIAAWIRWSMGSYHESLVIICDTLMTYETYLFYRR